MKQFIFAFLMMILCLSCGSQPKSLEERASDGDPEAQYKLALRYLDTLLFLNGDGSKLSEGINLLKLSAEQGNSDAQCKLGNSYINGYYGLSQDFDKGLDLLFSSASQDNSGAQFVIAGCYQSGQAVSLDYREAIKWYKLVEEQDDLLKSTAQVNIGICYYNLENYSEAIRWIRKAAEAGLSHAQFLLGISFLTGQGTIQDTQEARKWLQLAAEQGHKYAKTELEKLK